MDDDQVRPEDARALCAFMEADPDLPDCYSHLLESLLRWWRLGPVERGGMRWYPVTLTLDRLRLIEAKLTTEQRVAYLIQIYKHAGWEDWRCMHASARDKAAALVAALGIEGSEDRRTETLRDVAPDLIAVAKAWRKVADWQFSGVISGSVLLEGLVAAIDELRATLALLGRKVNDAKAEGTTPEPAAQTP